MFSDAQATCPDDANPTVETTPELLPEELRARFPEREPLAAGDTGTLYRVDDPGAAGRKLVLKVLSGKLTLDSSERARHRRDLRKQQSLVHPQLPRVIDEGESAGRVWFTREYTPGESLAVRLRRDGALPAPAAYGVIVQLAAALDGLHQLGLVHGDLKPGHVLLRAAQERISVQLIDATLAAPLTADRPSRRGTVDYAAKEVVEGAPASFRSDLYALGCLSYELLTGAPPFRDATQTTLEAQRSAEPKPLPDSVPATVRSVVTSMLAKDARRRPFSAQQVRRTFEPLLVPAKPAPRSAPRSALQREAAALRLTGSTAKSLAPVTAPDATVELDVDDLDEAIDELEKQQKREAAADDSAPNTQQPGAFFPPPKAAARTAVEVDKSATVPGGLGAPADAPPSAAGEPPRRTRTATKFGLGPVRTADIEAIQAAGIAAHQLHAREEPAEPAMATRSPELIAKEPALQSPSASGAEPVTSSSTAFSGEAGRGIAPTPSAPASAADSSNARASVAAAPSAPADAASAPAAAAPRGPAAASRPGEAAVSSHARASAPSAAADAADSSDARASAAPSALGEAPVSSRAGAAAAAPSAAAYAADSSNARASVAAAPSAPADAASAPASEVAPFGAPASVAATSSSPASAAAALSAPASASDAAVSSSSASAAPAAGVPAFAAASAADAAARSSHAALTASESVRAQASSAADVKSSSRRPRYSNAPQPLGQSPRLLLLAAAGLVALIVLLRLVLGPAERAHSPGVLVHVPQGSNEAATPSEALAELSDLGLIGGDITGIKRVPLVTAPRREPGQQSAAALAAESGTAEAPAPEPAREEPDSELAALEKQAQAISAVSVRGGLARASANRQAAANGGEVEVSDHKTRARELYKAGKYREAASAYQRATQHDTADAAAYAGLGGSLMATGDTRKAIAAYQRAVRLQPEVSGFQAALGRAYLKRGDRARARAAYSKALELDPNNQAARSGMANAKAR